MYGADFAYISFYSQDQASLKYMKNIRELMEELDLSSVVDKNISQRMSDNIDNQDSLMAMSSSLFRKIDNYLKNSDRLDVSVLVLTGGFIESLYFSSNLAKLDKSGAIASLIGQEKQTFITLVHLLSKSDDQNISSLVEKMKGLEAAFEQVTISYEFARPVTDPIKKTTRITSKTKVEISDKTVDEILLNTASLRTFITE